MFIVVERKNVVLQSKYKKENNKLVRIGFDYDKPCIIKQEEQNEDLMFFSFEQARTYINDDKKLCIVRIYDRYKKGIREPYLVME